MDVFVWYSFLIEFVGFCLLVFGTYVYTELVEIKAFGMNIKMKKYQILECMTPPKIQRKNMGNVEKLKVVGRRKMTDRSGKSDLLTPATPVMTPY